MQTSTFPALFLQSAFRKAFVDSWLSVKATFGKYWQIPYLLFSSTSQFFSQRHLLGCLLGSKKSGSKGNALERQYIITKAEAPPKSQRKAKKSIPPNHKFIYTILFSFRTISYDSIYNTEDEETSKMSTNFKTASSPLMKQGNMKYFLLFFCENVIVYLREKKSTWLHKS